MDDSSRRIKPIVEEIPASPAVEPTPTPQPTIPPPQATPPPTPVTTPIEPAHLPVMENQNGSDGGEHKEGRKLSGKLVLIIAIITAIVVSVVSGGVYVYYSGLTRDSSPSPTPSATFAPDAVLPPTPSPSPSPSPLPKDFDLSQFIIEVLNGTGLPGEASNAQEVLERAGFEVASTANADEFGLVSTVVQLKPSISRGVKDKLLETLSVNYTVEFGKALDEDSDEDIIITVGSASAAEEDISEEE